MNIKQTAIFSVLFLFIFSSIGLAAVDVDLVLGDTSMTYPTGFTEANHTMCRNDGMEAYANISDGYENASFRIGFTDGNEDFGNIYYDITFQDDPMDRNSTFCNDALWDPTNVIFLDSSFEPSDSLIDNKWGNRSDTQDFTYHDDDGFYCWGNHSITNETCDGIVNISLAVTGIYDVYAYGNCNATTQYMANVYDAGGSWTGWRNCTSGNKHWFLINDSVNVSVNPLRVRFKSGNDTFGGMNGEIDAIRIVKSSYFSEYRGGLAPLQFIGAAQPAGVPYTMWAYAYNMTDPTCEDFDAPLYAFYPTVDACIDNSCSTMNTTLLWAVAMMVMVGLLVALINVENAKMLAGLGVSAVIISIAIAIISQAIMAGCYGG